MNTADNDGCSATCAEEMDYICTGEPSVCTPDVCGDGILSINEECDDNNLMDGDGCDSGFCLDAQSGFDGGYCTSLCSLSANTCAAGNTCMDLFGLNQFTSMCH